MFRTIVLVGVAATVVAIVGHLVLFGAKRLGKGQGKRTVRRFSLWERFIHLLTVAGFLALVLTGFYAVVFLKSALHGWLWVIHVASAPALVIGLLLVLVTWAKDGRFTPCDWEWALKFGGYLWGDKHAPAERFNAGQKAYFWIVGLFGFVALVTGLGRAVPMLDPCGQEFLYQVHRYCALAFLLAGITHLYLGTFANPGTLGAMLTGKVTTRWAETHHPLWWKSLKEDDESKDA